MEGEADKGHIRSRSSRDNEFKVNNVEKPVPYLYFTDGIPDVLPQNQSL